MAEKESTHSALIFIFPLGAAILICAKVMYPSKHKVTVIEMLVVIFHSQQCNCYNTLVI